MLIKTVMLNKVMCDINLLVDLIFRFIRCTFREPRGVSTDIYITTLYEYNMYCTGLLIYV